MKSEQTQVILNSRFYPFLFHSTEQHIFSCCVISVRGVKSPNSVFSLTNSNCEDPDAEYESVSYRKVYLDDDDEDAEEADQDQGGGSTETSTNQQDGEDQHCSDDSCRYSEDRDSYSEDSEHDDTTKPDKGGE